MDLRFYVHILTEEKAYCVCRSMKWMKNVVNTTKTKYKMKYALLTRFQFILEVKKKTF